MLLSTIFIFYIFLCFRERFKPLNIKAKSHYQPACRSVRLLSEHVNQERKDI